MLKKMFRGTEFEDGVKQKIFLPKAFYLTLFGGNCQNKKEMKQNWIIKRKQSSHWLKEVSQ